VLKRTTRGLVKFDGGSFRLIKPLIGYQEDIQNQLIKFPFEKNVFLMLRFRDENQDLSDYIIKRLKAAGLKGVRADQPQWNITNDVYNPIAVLYCCKYGIALFDKAEENQAYNPNVIYELAIMHSLGRECMILRNISLPPVPFDLLKNLYTPYADRDTIQRNIRLWVQQILPKSAVTRPGVRSTPEAKLEYAAVSARRENKASVIESPEAISAADLTWQIVAEEQQAWKLVWSINLTNQGQRPFDAKVQVLFLDKNSLALDKHTGPSQKLSPGITLHYEAETSMDPDLAGLVHGAVAVVTRPKE
jgi:hypothetical protein